MFRFFFLIQRLNLKVKTERKHVSNKNIFNLKSLRNFNRARIKSQKLALYRTMQHQNKKVLKIEKKIEESKNTYFAEHVDFFEFNVVQLYKI